MTNGEVYNIKEFRTNECWTFERDSENSNFDISLMILDRPIPGAKKGVHYVDTWNSKTMGTVVGKTMTLAGWGASGAIRDDRSTDHFDDRMAVFHRGYNKIEALY